MSEVDNLESLNNQQLRARCLEYGISVPVTDSSRNVILKKLRASIAGDATIKKLNNRRETIQVARESPIKTIEDVAAANNRRVNNRRTISNTPTRDTGNSVSNNNNNNSDLPQNKEKKAPIGISERRRSTLRDNDDAAAAQSTGATAPAPTIGERRRSAIREVVKPPQKEDKAPAAAPISTRRRSTFLDEPILIESEDEDDAILYAAADKAERKTEADAPKRRSSRSGSIPKSNAGKTSYTQNLATLEEQEVVEPATTTVPQVTSRSYVVEQKQPQQKSQQYQPTQQQQHKQPQQLVVESISNYSHTAAATKVNQPESFGTLYPQTQMRTIGESVGSASRPSYETHSPYTGELTDKHNFLQPSRPQQFVSQVTRRLTTIGAPIATSASGGSVAGGNYYSPSSRYTGIGVGTTSSSLYTTPSTAYNEFSDYTDGDENGAEDAGYETPFLSSFARNLNRIKAEPLGSKFSSASLTGDSNASGITSTYRYKRPSVYAGNSNATKNSKSLFVSLEQKYKLKQNLFCLFVLLLIVFLIVLFWQ